MAGGHQDIAIIGYAQSPSWRSAELTEPQFLFPVISEAIERAGIERRELGFTCAGSMGIHRFLHTLEIFGTDPPVVPYSPDQVDTRHEVGANAISV